MSTRASPTGQLRAEIGDLFGETDEDRQLGETSDGDRHADQDSHGGRLLVCPRSRTRRCEAQDQELHRAGHRPFHLAQ